MQVRRCEVCGTRAARYVCQECGRQACERCLEPHTWMCTDCYRRLRPQVSAKKTFSWSLPLKILFFGFLLSFTGIIRVIIASFISGAAAALIWILPLPPIILGVGWPYSPWIIILAVALTGLSLILFVLFRKRDHKI